MKRFLLFVFSILLTFSFAIAQDGINYQGAATDVNGDELTNQNITIRASVLSTSANGNLEWEETHSTTTDQFGLFNVVIGQGTNTTNGATATFDDMDWGSGNHFLKIEMDATGGTNYAMIGTTQMMSVPYALYAKSAGIDSTMLANMIGSSGGGGAFADWELLYDCLNCGQTLPWGTVDRFGVAESDGFLYVIATDAVLFTGDDFDSTTIAWSGDINQQNLRNYNATLIPLKKDMFWHIQFHSTQGEVRKAYFVPNSGGGSSTVSSSGNGSGCDFKYPDGLDGEVVNLDLANDYTVPSGKTLYLTNIFLYGEYFYLVLIIQYILFKKK